MLELLSSLDSPAALVLLAAISFGDSLIGTSVFVFGELAFIAAGAALAATGSFVPAIIVLICAWAGDVASYLIGRKFGRPISAFFLRRQKRRRVWRRARAALAQRGAVFVVASRFLGPVAWVTPFLAGSLAMPARRFLPAAALGVLLGVGQFLIYGAVGARLIELILPLFQDHLAVILLFLGMIVAFVAVWRRSKPGLWTRALKSVAAAALVFLISNYVYFFVHDSHAATSTTRTTFGSVCEAAAGPFTVDPGTTSLHLPQPVNVVLLSETPGADLMQSLGWHRNATFTHDQISFSRYLRLLADNTPPISELYHQGIPADSAHQMPGTLKVREHIRWWDMGGGVHFGAISRTDELAVKYYSHLPVLLHDIDPNVDASRALLSAQIEDLAGFDILGLGQLAAPVDEEAFGDYRTDGDVLVITQSGFDLPPDIAACLQIR